VEKLSGPRHLTVLLSRRRLLLRGRLQTLPFATLPRRHYVDITSIFFFLTGHIILSPRFRDSLDWGDAENEQNFQLNLFRKLLQLQRWIQSLGLSPFHKLQNALVHVVKLTWLLSAVLQFDFLFAAKRGNGNQ